MLLTFCLVVWALATFVAVNISLNAINHNNLSAFKSRRRHGVSDLIVVHSHAPLLIPRHRRDHVVKLLLYTLTVTARPHTSHDIVGHKISIVIRFRELYNSHHVF